MVSLHPCYQWLRPLVLLLVISFSASVSSVDAVPQPHNHKIPRLGIIDRLQSPVDASAVSASSLSKEFESNFYNQTLDHFNFNPKSFTKFQQYYVINSKYWGGANSSSPIFAYLGAEEPLDEDIPIIGFLKDNAPRFKALQVYIEHRFYGKSNPVGSMNKTMADKEIRGYFSSAQALADYAEILLHVKEKFCAHDSPIIVTGGSYGGMLATWFRLKYPHIALGALASSAPILYFDDITPQTGYYSKVTQDFREESENCYKTIRDSWTMIDKVASKPSGLSTLRQTFKTCKPLNNSGELKNFLNSLYCSTAQYNAPPRYPVTQFCKGVDESPKGTALLDRVFAGIVSLRGNRSCYDADLYIHPSQTYLGWNWQTCSELVIPISQGGNETMFPVYPFVLKDVMESCYSSYGVYPRPHWITTYYGGHDIKLILKKFGSNIIFSNGLRDPYSTGGVLENLSRSLLAIYTKQGSHCLDILTSHKTDPAWLVAQRKREVAIIEGWIKSYYADLAVLKGR